MKRSCLFIALFFAWGNSFCQLVPMGLERQAINKIDKQNWQKAEELLRKSLKKEPDNAEAEFVFASLFLYRDYPNFNIDSSHYYLSQSLKNFSNATSPQREKMKRFPLDSGILLAFKSKIDSTAFAMASSQHTEKAYNDFLLKFNDAAERQKAIELRDELAYVDALRNNTFKSFQEYLRKYPDSFRAAEAKQRYEKLLFEDQTKDGKLVNFIAFLKNYPNTEYRTEVEKNIFEVITAAGDASAFKSFLKTFPESKFAKKAANILYYLNEDETSTEFLNDSLLSLSALRKGFWLPVLKDGKFGFINQDGDEKLAPRFTGIDDSYKCGNIMTDYFITTNGVVSRSGKLILEADAKKIEDLGYGYLKIKSRTCWRLVHESGFKIGGNCLEDAKLIASRFIALKEKGKWNILTLTGKLLNATTFDDVYAIDEIIVFVKAGKRVLKSIQEVAAMADGAPWAEALVYDGIQALGQNQYLVNNGSLQGVISSTLKYIVPLDRQTILQTPYGFIQEKNKKLRVLGVSKEIDSKDFVKVDFYKNWVKLKEKNNLMLYDGKNKKVIDSNLDSLWFENSLAFALKKDSVAVHFNSASTISIEATSVIHFMKSIDSVRYFYAADSKKKTVLEIATGKKLFSLKATAIEYVGDGTFLIDDNGKKGLVNQSGKALIPAEYSAIVVNGSYASLLKDKKFGLYDLKKRILIKPIYERNLIPYSEEKLIAFKNGFYGFVSWELKDESKFEFEEVKFWSEKVALVKKNQWLLYDMQQKKIVMEKIKDVTFISDTKKEKVVVFRQENYFGVMSSRRGIIIPASFNEIINLGTPETPVYFTEKFIKEADIHVVIYYNTDGKLVRKQAYETSDYERIYCEDK